MTTRVILDCDPGHDDALAIVLAHGTPEIELVAITTVAGNHGLELTTLNARRICSLCSIDDVPIAAGCAAPLVRPLITAPQIHGVSGLEGYNWPEPTVGTVSDHAVDLVIDLVMAAPGEITLVPTGPLTNIAMAVRKEPRFAARVREVVLMDWAFRRGNQTPAAEFNTYVDPEAAAIVFGAGWQVTMIGLEVTEMALATEDVFQRIEAVATPVAQAVTGMLRFYQAQQQREVGIAAPPVHDPCAVARVARPGLVECRDAHVEVELAGRRTTGMTVTDFREVEGRPFNTRVGTSLDMGGFWDLFLEALSRIGH